MSDVLKGIAADPEKLLESYNKEVKAKYSVTNRMFHHEIRVERTNGQKYYPVHWQCHTDGFNGK